MKKITTKISATIMGILPNIALAVDPNTVPDAAIINANPDIKRIIVNVVNIILGFAGALAVLFIIIGGIRYMTSTGNPDAIEGAKKTLLFSIAGLLIIVLSLVIINLVINFSGVIANPG